MTTQEQQFQSFVDALELEIDKVVETGTDDEVFISGYLNGHVSLAAGYCLSHQLYSRQGLEVQVANSLESAFANNELEEPDQIAVKRYWQSCLKNVV